MGRCGGDSPAAWFGWAFPARRGEGGFYVSTVSEQHGKKQLVSRLREQCTSSRYISPDSPATGSFGSKGEAEAQRGERACESAASQGRTVPS